MFFHWFTLFFNNMVLLTLSNICLLIFCISVLDRFIRRQDILLGSPSLWSLIVTYASFSSNFCTRSPIFNLLAISFLFEGYRVRFIGITFVLCFCNISVHHSFITSFTYFDIFLDLSGDINSLLLLCNCLISFLKFDWNSLLTVLILSSLSYPSYHF